MTAPLLRMWQARYAFVEPRRGAGGQRLYSEDDVAFLGAVRSLVDRGYAIGELATWSRRELLRAAEHKLVVENDKATKKVTAKRHVDSEAEATDPATITLSLERDGRITTVSPNSELLLGWPHGLLIGQPVWGIFLDVASELVAIVAGEQRQTSERVFWAWLRARSGAPVPCRVVCGVLRRSNAATTTVRVSPLAASGTDVLSNLLFTLERERPGSAVESPEQLMKDWAEHAVAEHRAALARAWLYRASDNTLRLVASAGLSRSILSSSRAVIRLATYPYKVGVVARTGIPFLRNGLDSERDFDLKWVRKEHLESVAVMPLTAGGVLFGVTVEFFPHRLTSEAIGRIQTSATSHGTALERFAEFTD